MMAAKVLNVKKHILKIHEDHKDYKCKFCEKLFSESQSLKDHIKRIHNGQKDIGCKICNKLFFTAGDASKHIKNYHGKRSNEQPLI